MTAWLTSKELVIDNFERGKSSEKFWKDDGAIYYIGNRQVSQDEFFKPFQGKTVNIIVSDPAQTDQKEG